MPKKNDLIFFSEGSYSDYGVMGHFKVLKDFSMKEQGKRFLEMDRGVMDVLEYYDRSTVPWIRLPKPVKTGEKPVPATTDAFQSYLIREGLVENVDVTEYHVGDYDFMVPDID